MKGWRLFAVAVVTMSVGFVMAGAAREGYLKRHHQDVVCYSATGDILVVANDVEVQPTSRRFRIIWPDGKRRDFLTGSCEWAPHDPERQYPPEKIQSWEGGPDDKSVRNA